MRGGEKENGEWEENGDAQLAETVIKYSRMVNIDGHDFELACCLVSSVANTRCNLFFPSMNDEGIGGGGLIDWAIGTPFFNLFLA